MEMARDGSPEEVPFHVQAEILKGEKINSFYGGKYKTGLITGQNVDV